MKVSLPDNAANVRAYGMDFDEDGVCDIDKKIVQSLLDAELLVETTVKKAAQ